MSNDEQSTEKSNEEQIDTLNPDEELAEDTMTSQETRAKADIHAWRKRNSYAFQRKPLLVRRMSRGEIKQIKHYFVNCPTYICLVI